MVTHSFWADNAKAVQVILPYSVVYITDCSIEQNGVLARIIATKLMQL